MFSDHTLTPKEATRLCALGTLAMEPMSYRDLAVSLRHFVGRVIGPTAEIMGHSIELLKYEGLVKADEGEESPLHLTDKGKGETRRLLTANVRSTSTDLSKLVIALKFRFLHLLPVEEQLAQAEMLMDVCERELARLQDLRDGYTDVEGYLAVWLTHDIDLVHQRLGWLTEFGRGLKKTG
jgi:hypothetical protein